MLFMRSMLRLMLMALSVMSCLCLGALTLLALVVTGIDVLAVVWGNREDLTGNLIGWGIFTPLLAAATFGMFKLIKFFNRPIDVTMRQR